MNHRNHEESMTYLLISFNFASLYGGFQLSSLHEAIYQFVAVASVKNLARPLLSVFKPSR